MVDRYDPKGVRPNLGRSSKSDGEGMKGRPPCLLHSGSGEPTMAGGEPSTMVNTDTAFWATFFQVDSMGVMSKTLQTRLD